jgi:hypothetical protein
LTGNPSGRLALSQQKIVTFDAVLLSDVSRLLEHARQSAGLAVSAVMSVAYWQFGRRIAQQVQKASDRASYGEELVTSPAKDLTMHFGRGFSRTNVFQMGLFFLAYREKIKTLSECSGSESIVPTPSGLSSGHPACPLSRSHYVRLLTVPETQARTYYEHESLRGGWSVRKLDRLPFEEIYKPQRVRSWSNPSIG